jgi:integrase
MKKITVRPYRSAARPHLKFSVNFNKGSRRFFEKRVDAENFARAKNTERMRDGLRGANFEAEEQLKPFGATIRDAVAFYVAHLKASKRSCNAVELVEELLAAKEADGVSKRHLDDLRCRLGIFAADFNGKMVSDISSSEIDTWLRSLRVSANTRNHYRRLIILAFNHAKRAGFVTANPAIDTAKAKEVSGEIGIVSPTEAALLLSNATPDMVPYCAIALFAGLRCEEIKRLTWNEIDFESGLIEVKAAKSKTAQRRFVTILPNLREWLLPYRKLAGHVVRADTFRRSFEAARTAAGITDWKHNALRHSFASYHLAKFQNAAVTALQLGHVNAAITFSHYRELVKPKDAERYWNLRPSVAPAEKIVRLA